MILPVSRNLFLAASLGLALSCSLYAAEPEATPRIPTISVTGEAVVTMNPDQAEIDIGVTTEAGTAVAAAGENAAKLSKVMAELEKRLDKRGELKTIGYSVDPVYRRPKSGPQEIVEYRVTNIVRATERVVSVTENERGFRPIVTETRALEAEAMAVPTPIEAGTIEIRSSITLKAELAK